jgi:hypothetical protein
VQLVYCIEGHIAFVALSVDVHLTKGLFTILIWIDASKFLLMAGTFNVGKTRKFMVEICERKSAWDRLVKVSFVGHHVCCNEMFYITVSHNMRPGSVISLFTMLISWCSVIPPFFPLACNIPSVCARFVQLVVCLLRV